MKRAIRHIRRFIRPWSLFTLIWCSMLSHAADSVIAPKITPKRYSGEKLSINFQNIEVRSVLQVIAEFRRLNMVVSDAVTGSLTLKLKDTPWDQALDIILQTRGLGMHQSGNVMYIAPREELAAKEQADLEARKKISDLEPIRTQSYQLNYTKAKEVANGLRGLPIGAGASSGITPSLSYGSTSSNINVRSILSNRGSVIPDERTNQLFVTDIADKLKEVEQLIAKIDVPVRQVMIEARIVEANDTFGKSLGVKLGINENRLTPNAGVPLGHNGRITFGGNLAAVGAQTGQPDTLATYSNTQLINLPANKVNNFDPATFALSIFGATSNRFLNLELSALEADGQGKVVSSPRIVTADKVEAYINQGYKIPFNQASTSGATSVQFIEAGLRLKVTPQITPEGNVILDVMVNKDSLGNLTPVGREINTKEVKTQVLVDNGGTVVIGGIYEQEENTSQAKVPLLGDLPVLGQLFKNNTRDTRRTELLVFLTPRILFEKP
jgi:type IV pilus assembly protein PilQ